MHWLNERLGSLILLACSLTAILLVFSWADSVSPLTLIKKAPKTLRQIAGGLFLIGIANLVIWTPAIATAFVATHWIGDWGLLFAWLGIGVGWYLLKLTHKSLLAVYLMIAGSEA